MTELQSPDEQHDVGPAASAPAPDGTPVIELAGPVGVDSQLHGLVAVDAHLRIQAVDGAAFADAIDGSAAKVSLIGKQILDLVEPGDRARLRRVLNQVDVTRKYSGWLTVRMWSQDDQWHQVRVVVGHNPSAAGGFLFTLHPVSRADDGLGRRAIFDHIVHHRLRQLGGEAVTDFDEAVVGALGDVCELVEADRAYIVVADLMSDLLCFTHEWSRPGFEHVVQRPQIEPVIIDESLKRLGADLSQAGWRPWRLGGGPTPAVSTGRSARGFVFRIEDDLVGCLCLESFSGTDLDALEEAPFRRIGRMFAQALIGRAARDGLALAEAKSRAAFDDSAVPLVLCDAEGIIINSNPVMATMTGVSVSRGRRAVSLFHTDDRPRIEAVIARASEDSEFVSVSKEVRVQTTAGLRWFRVNIRAVRGAANVTELLSLTFEDMAATKAAEERHRRSAQRYEDLIGLLPDPMFLIDRQGKVRFSNSTSIELFREHLDATTGALDLTELAHSWLETAEDTTPHDRYRAIDHVIRVAGGDRSFEVRLVSEFDADAELDSVLVVLRDLTERQRALARLAHQATHDSLTGLPNRAAFMEALADALRTRSGSPGSVAVLFFDLDRFKVVNDSLGHVVGDELLIHAAERLREAVRLGDMLARLGGDEFIILLADVLDTAEIDDTVARLLEALARPIQLGSHEFALSASVGVAMTDDPTESPTELLRGADAAMYRAKALGRGQHSYFDDELAKDVSENLELDQRLVHALERREVRVYFQPEVDLATGAITGCEALLRWDHPQRGLLSLGQFVRIAEDSGAIVGMGSWVLDQACRYARKWAAADDTRFRLRVNMSIRELERPDVVDRVAAALDGSGLPARQLCIEITESAMSLYPERMMAVLEGLAALGIELAIDDFGTGYSSLSYLKKLPVDVLKIDRSFVDGLPDDEDDLALVEVIINLARTMEMNVTAEGIENDRQRQSLVSMGCTRGQGFLFDKALPAEAFDELIRERGGYDLDALVDFAGPDPLDDTP